MSTQLMSALDSSPVNLISSVGLQLVCIDNEEIRDRILTANKISISSVPCILIVYRTGGVEKFEGKEAIQWIEETVRKFMPPPPIQPTVQSSPVQEPPRRHKPRRRREQEPESESGSDYESSEEEYAEEQRGRRSNRTSKPARPPSKPDRPHRTPSRPNRPSSKRPSTDTTTLEDLDDPDDNSQQRRPPVAMISGPGGFEMIDDFGEVPDQNRDMSSRTRATTQPATGGGSDLMSTVMAMQKEREAYESSIKPVGAQPKQRPF